MKKLISTILTTILLSTTSFAKSDTNSSQETVIKTSPIPELETIWEKAYGGSDKDKANAVIALKDGTLLVAGSSKSYGKGRGDMLIARVQKDGKVSYRSSYGGKQEDSANALTATSDGNFIAVGYSKTYSKNQDKDVFVVKFDDKGKKLWQKHYGGDRDDEAYSVVGTNNGGAIIVGYTESYGKGYKDVYIIYIDKDGKEIWSKAIGGKDDDFAKSISLTHDGFYVAGATRSFGAGGFDFYLLKFDKDAKLEFKKVYGEIEDDVLNAVTTTKDGGCVVAGWTKSFGSKHSDIDVIRYSKSGEQVWHKIYGFKSKEAANDVVAMPDGGFLVAGYTKSMGFGANDFYILELKSNGSSKWANVYGGSAKDSANAIARKPDGSYVVVGQTLSFGNGDYDFMMLELRK